MCIRDRLGVGLLRVGLLRVRLLRVGPVSYTHLDVYKRQEPSDAMDELIPTSRPSEVTRAPPELPGLMAAEVWMALVTTVSEPLWPRVALSLIHI